MTPRLSLIAPPVASAVALGEAKQHLRVTHHDEDAYITSLIDVATADIEKALGDHKLINQTWRATFVGSVPAYWSPPYRPVQVLHTSVATMDGYTVDFTVGYGAPDDVPAPILHAVLMVVGHLYANREVVSATPMHEVPFAVGALLSKYRTQYV